MRLNTHFQTRSNALYTRNNTIVQNVDSTIQRVYHVLSWYTPQLIVPLISSLLSQLLNFTYFSASHLPYLMMIDHDAFLPAVVMLSHTPCHLNINSCRQYNGTHFDDTAPAPRSVQMYQTHHISSVRHKAKVRAHITHLSTVNVHSNRPIDCQCPLCPTSIIRR
jgi:hypothetical protein